MTPFATHRGIVAPLDRSNVDTDALMPKQFLKSISRTGFADNLFDEWRYLDQGALGMDNSKRPRNPEFVLNDPSFAPATVLLSRANFGCGSSREHAVWALHDYGFRAVIASSFADIFYGNCFKNGLLPVVLRESEIDALFATIAAAPGSSVLIDLRAQAVATDDGARYEFDIDASRKRSLIEGLDDIALTLRKLDAIDAYEARRKLQEPWLFN
ncbi:3-isopropylmalate dehydratase small subunit [soil metagenome]